MIKFQIQKLYEQICHEKYFHTNINISLCDKYFYKNKKSKLRFEDRVAVQNDILFKYGGSIPGPI